MKRRELEPAKWLKGRPKREMSPFGHVFKRHVVIARYEGYGVEYQPKVAENGYTERSNPSVALSARQGMEQASRPQAQAVEDTPRSKGRRESLRIG